MKTKLLHQLITIGCLALVFQSCAPVFSDLQSARTVGKNKVELTPSFSNIFLADKASKEHVENHLGIQVAYGLTSKIDLRFRYEQYLDWGFGVWGIGPKFSLLENRIAFSLPVMFQGGIQFHPTILFTLPVVKEKLELNLAPKYLFPLFQPDNGLMAINMGFSCSKNFKKWAIRPEYGVLFVPGGSGHFGHLSLGFSIIFGK